MMNNSAQPEQIEVLDSGEWIVVPKEAELGFGWVRFHYPDGRVAIAAPQRWREHAEDNLPK